MVKRAYNPGRCVDAAGIRAELAPFEERYGLTSQTFYDRWRRGGDPAWDTLDFTAWAILCDLAVHLGVLREDLAPEAAA